MDAQAQALWNARNIVGLLEYLNGQWTRMLMPMLEDLNRLGFNPATARDLYEADWKKANISRDMLFAAGLTVTEKLAHERSWPEAYDAWRRYYALVNNTVIQEFRLYWAAGPNPGKGGAATPGNVHLSSGEDWFVTDLSVHSAGATIGIGWTGMTGTITFEKYRVDDGEDDGDPARAAAKARAKANTEISVTRNVKMAGPTAGASVDLMSIGQYFRNLRQDSGLYKWLTKPNLAITEDAVRLVQAANSRFHTLIATFPRRAALAEYIALKAHSASAGKADWTSRTAGMVLSTTGRRLTEADLRGGAIGVSFTAGAAAGVGISGGGYLIAFGPKVWDPTEHWTAVVFMGTGGVAAALPSVGAGFGLLVGQIS